MGIAATQLGGRNCEPMDAKGSGRWHWESKRLKGFFLEFGPAISSLRLRSKQEQPLGISERGFGTAQNSGVRPILSSILGVEQTLRRDGSI
jgi:hypothetical protein